MLNHFEMSSNIEDDLFGKRLNLMKEKFEMFLDLMVKQGAILIFAFKKNRFRELDFLISEENDYKKSKMFLHNLKTLNTIEVVDNFKKHRNRKLSCMEIVSIALVQSAQKFGKLCGVMDSSIKHSTFVTELATNEDAMAIMGTDSNYFFYNGR